MIKILFFAIIVAFLSKIINVLFKPNKKNKDNNIIDAEYEEIE